MYVRTDLSPGKRRRFSAKPDFIADSVADINFAFLEQLGIKACFIDLDGTVVERGNYDVDKQLVRKLRRQKLKLYIATNRPRSRALQNLKEDLSAQGVIHPSGVYGKPMKHYYAAALRTYGLLPREVVMIGDRYIQDVIGANRSGLYSLVVNKLGAPVGRFDAALSRLEARITTRFFAGYKKL